MEVRDNAVSPLRRHKGPVSLARRAHKNAQANNEFEVCLSAAFLEGGADSEPLR